MYTGVKKSYIKWGAFVLFKKIFIYCFIFPAPPSYEESIFHSPPMVGDEPEEAHTTGGMTNWAPSYIYYNWNQPTQPIPNLPPPAYNQL